ncbi:hypothetical protein [Halosolutus gelatinilyticus]|uniref:hypothetical protein n=1 Tax=Halosolutus gelatinilyticus TaxID=2931975 RepID=UPI001FF2AFA9|nr:hypothetical protein [Halosolutus gelatinilyticus]
MTDSTAGNSACDGGFEVGPSADELFGDIEESFEEETTDHEEDGASAGGKSIEDRTAADVFAQLQSDVGDDTDEVLSDESPEDIIASADDPDPEPEVDGALLVDEGELEALLLTGRTKEQEFLWVDPVKTADASTAADAPTDGRSDGDDDRSEAGDVTGGSIDKAPAEPGASATTGDEETGADEPSDDDGDGPAATPFAGDEDVGSAFGDGAADAEPDSDREAESAPEEAESDETSLMVKDDEQALATTDGDEETSGILGWLRSKFGNLL